MEEYVIDEQNRTRPRRHPTINQAVDFQGTVGRLVPRSVAHGRS
jgi:hypothetical protein